MRKPRDRKLDDLTPALAEYILWHAVTYLQMSREAKDWPFYGSQPTEQAIRIIRNAIDSISHYKMPQPKEN